MAVARSTDGEAAVLDVPPMECCLTVVVRNAARLPGEVPFELVVEVAPYETVVGVVEVHGHAH